MKKYTFIERIKQLGRLIGYIFITLWHVLKDKRTWITVALLLAFYLWGWFNANYYVNDVKDWHIIESRYKTIKPIKKLTVVTKKPIVAEVKPTYTAEQENAFDTVWFNESNRGNDKSGLNGACIQKGMINEIGYAPHESYCFKDRAEQKETFMLWLNNRLTHKKSPYCNTIKECILFYTNNSYTI